MLLLSMLVHLGLWRFSAISVHASSCQKGLIRGLSFSQCFASWGISCILLRNHGDIKRFVRAPLEEDPASGSKEKDEGRGAASTYQG